MAAMDEKGNGGACLVMPGANPNDVAAGLLDLLLGAMSRCKNLEVYLKHIEEKNRGLLRDMEELKAQLFRAQNKGTKDEGEERHGDLN